MDREGPIQRAVVQYLRAVLPRALVHHSANEGQQGGRRGAIAGAIRRGQGQIAGWPDVTVVLPEPFRPVFFEVKAPGGSVSPVQRALMVQLEALGCRCAVVRSVDEVREALALWGIWTADRSTGWRSVGEVAANMAERAGGVE